MLDAASKTGRRNPTPTSEIIDTQLEKPDYDSSI